MKGKMKEKICHYLAVVVEEVSAEEFLDMIETPPEEEMGDLALPCFGLARKLHRNPKIIAAEITEKMNTHKEALRIERVEHVGAYCNIFWNREAYVEIPAVYGKSWRGTEWYGQNNLYGLFIAEYRKKLPRWASADDNYWKCIVQDLSEIRISSGSD